MSRFTRIAAAREQAAFQLLADPDTTLNFIPVDLVTSSAVDIALKGSGETFFHLTNGTPAVVGEAIPVAAEMLGLAPPVFTSDPAHLTRLDRRLSRFLDFYLPYLGADREFDRTNTDAVVGDRCDFGMGTPAIAQLVGAWMESAALN